MKVPQLRNLYEKVGCDLTQTSNRAGFGFLQGWHYAAPGARP